MIGINDIAGGISEETIWDNYQRIVIKLKNELPETELYIEALLPCGNEKGDLYNTKIVSLNEKLVILADEQDCEYIDLYEKFVDKKGYLKAEYNYDNVHITIDGYSLWFNEVRKYI